MKMINQELLELKNLGFIELKPEPPEPEPRPAWNLETSSHLNQSVQIH